MVGALITTKMSLNHNNFNMLQENVLYFAYGSNLSLKRLENRVGNVDVYGNHRLYGYKLTFDACSQFGDAYANIQKSDNPSDFVEGVLYEMTPVQFSILDKYEGLYDRNYFVLPNGRICCTYVSYVSKNDYSYPSVDYLNIIIDGYKTWQLTQIGYLLKVKSLSEYREREEKKKSRKRKKDVVRTTIKRKLPGYAWP